MNFYDTRSSYLKLNEEISKIKTQSDFNIIKNHIKENLIDLNEKEINKLVETFNKKGGNLNINEFLQLKEAIEDDTFDLDVENEDYIDIDDDENFIEDENEEQDEYITVKVTNIEPLFTMEDIESSEADELGITPEEYLENCIESIRQYFKETLGDPFYCDVPKECYENDVEIEEFITYVINEETGYLVDSFEWEIVNEDEEQHTEESLKEDNNDNIDVYDEEEYEDLLLSTTHGQDLSDFYEFSSDWASIFENIYNQLNYPIDDDWFISPEVLKDDKKVNALYKALRQEIINKFRDGSIKEIIDNTYDDEEMLKNLFNIKIKYEDYNSKSIKNSKKLNEYKILNNNDNNDIYNKNKINKKNKGGIITLSLNVTNNKKYTKDQRLQYTGANYDYKSIIKDILDKNNISGATISNINDGIYKENEEKSIDIKLIGIDTKTLDKLAQNLASEFKQDEVLVNNLNNNKIYFITNVGKYYWNFSKFNEAYYNQETGKVEPELFYGVPGVEYISHGEWNDPEVYYEGKSYNYHDLEDSLWELFEDDIDSGELVIDTTGYEDLPRGSKEEQAKEDAFEKWVKDNANLVYNELNNLEPIEESCNNKNESLKESTEIDRQLFVSLVRLGDNSYDGYSILNDGNFVTKIYAQSDEEAKQKFQDYINKEQLVVESIKNSRYKIKPLIESNETDIKKAELQAYKKLKKNKNLYAVIYAYSQGNKKIVLNPVLEKDNQEEVDKFVNAFKKGKQGQQIIVYVYYQSQINKLDKKFNNSKEGENK